MGDPVSEGEFNRRRLEVVLIRQDARGDLSPIYVRWRRFEVLIVALVLNVVVLDIHVGSRTKIVTDPARLPSKVVSPLAGFLLCAALANLGPQR